MLSPAFLVPKAVAILPCVTPGMTFAGSHSPLRPARPSLMKLSPEATVTGALDLLLPGCELELSIPAVGSAQHREEIKQSLQKVPAGANGLHWLQSDVVEEMRFHHVGQAGLKLLTSGDLPTSASQSAGITEAHAIVQAGVLWHNLGLLQLSPPGFKWSFTMLVRLVLNSSSVQHALASQSARMTCMSHCAQLIAYDFKLFSKCFGIM
ncbi:Protein GVQW1, partial [Plecturocebus cupreus]